MNDAIITYFGQRARVICDRQCQKAWGIQNRPRVQLSEDPDDFAYLSDGELGEAPINPGTYEGGAGKPHRPDRFPTKWCVRECERCAMSMTDENEADLAPIDFSTRSYNMPHLHQ